MLKYTEFGLNGSRRVTERNIVLTFLKNVTLENKPQTGKAFVPGSVLGDMEQLLGQQDVTSSIGDSSSIRAELAHFYIIIYTAG